MRLFKAVYKDKDGKNRKSLKWYLDFADHNEIRHKIPGFSDKRQSESLGRQIEKLVNARSGEGLDASLSAWLEMIPSRMMKHFVSWGLVERHRAAIGQALVQHLDDFKKSLMADGCTDRHAKQKCGRARKILFDDCGFLTFADIRASKVKLAIDQVKRTVRKKVDGELQDVELGPAAGQTKTHYTRDLRAFTAWAFLDGRTMSDPLALLKRDSQKKKSKAAKTQTRSFKRRALDPQEIGQLLVATEAADLRCGLTGYERAAVYRLAIETGLRAGEIRSLKPCDIDLTEGFVRVVPQNTKNGEEAILPLRKDLCDTLKVIAANKHPEAPLFRLPGKPAVMLRKDLKAARIDPEDQAKGRCDFHGLRHCFGSLLAAAGVHPKIAQDLMRHSDINLTMSRYTHTLLGQGAKAVESLPDFMAIAKEAEAKKKTGTDGKSVDCIGAEDQEGGKSGENHLATHLAICLDKTSGNQRNPVDSSGQKVLTETTGKSGVSSQKAGFRAQKGESQRSDLNRQPPVYKTGALPLSYVGIDIKQDSG